MARKVIVSIVDDFDGTSEADETATFGIDGVAYEIDLSDTNATKLRDTFDQWLPYARRIGRAKTSTGRLATKTPASAPIRRNDLADIRAWASKNGHTVSTCGQISTEFIAAYEAASA
ncbi:histone-like nucleoid-structuring protein Lsr2 [Nocardia salmonicida]|uniref:histone-like nucleoid-structuring protein Lsr2 n=1 Tax=Nocardia salmonicida TaxID=53431 RepID=UPI0007A3C844|nr:Lsr2 family protein [Nocardia salmonicida]